MQELQLSATLTLPLAHIALGWVQLWQKNGEEAVRSFRKGISLDPNNVDGIMFLSMCLSSMGSGEEALHYIEMSMRFTPYPNPFLMYVFGLAHYVLGQFEQARLAWEGGQ